MGDGWMDRCFKFIIKIFNRIDYRCPLHSQSLDTVASHILTCDPTYSRFVGIGNKKPPSGSLVVKVSGAISASTPWLVDPCIFPTRFIKARI